MEHANRPVIAAYYFPQYHRDPRNDVWHGHGWTEWELMKQAKPRFAGHRQPIVPAWGYFDESDPAWAGREIDLAANHGVNCFLYDWYWYDGTPFLQDGLEKGFLRAENNQRMKFALMWANHNWMNIHPAKFTNCPELLATGGINREGFARLTKYVIEHYFTRPNYLTLDGAPYFSIYDLGTFLKGMGGLENAAGALADFRAQVRAAGFPDLHLNAILWGMQILPSELGVENPSAVLDTLQFSSVGSYTWVHYYGPDTDGFPKGNYERAAAHNIRLWEEHTRLFPLPYHINVSMGWDPSPRTVQSDAYEARGYPWTSVLMGNTPAAFKSALQQARAFLGRDEVRQKVLTLNAWNEWTEGSYLLPDTVNGTAYLDAIRDVFGAESQS